MKIIRFLTVLCLVLTFSFANAQTKYKYNQSKVVNLVQKLHNDHSYTSLLSKLDLSDEHQIAFSYVMCVIATQDIQDQRNIASGVIAYLRNDKIFSKEEFGLLNSFVQKDRNASKSFMKLKTMKKFSTPQAGAIIGAFTSSTSNETSYGLVDSGVELVSIVIGGGAGAIGGGVGGAISGGVVGAGVGTVTIPGFGTVGGGTLGAIGGGITGVISGGAAGAGVGGAIGDKLGDLIEGAVDSATSSDSTATNNKGADSGKEGDSFMLGPNGEDCTPPFFQF